MTYSLGMKKRLALAMALMHEPRVLIMDEPTNGLDPTGAREMRATIAEYAAGGRTIFLSTHLLDAAERLCHRVAIIRDGRLQAVGAPDELRARFAAAPGTTLEDLFLRVTAEDRRRRRRRPRAAAASVERRGVPSRRHAGAAHDPLPAALPFERARARGAAAASRCW